MHSLQQDSIKVMIIDDEQPARQRLSRLLAVYEHLEIIALASNGEQALDKIKKQPPNLIFLDISMPIMNGMQLATILTKDFPHINIIFTTAYDQYALEAFEVNAHDYLLKPIRQERLNGCLKKLQLLSKNLLQQDESITIKDKDSLKRIALADIICLHADQKYTEVHTLEAILLSTDSLKMFEKDFAQHFIRIHRSTLVNKAYLTGIETTKKGALALLKGCEISPEISRRHQSEVRQFLQSS